MREARRACLAELDAKGIDRLAYNTAASAADLIDLRRTLGYVSWDIQWRYPTAHVWPRKPWCATDRRSAPSCLPVRHGAQLLHTGGTTALHPASLRAAVRGVCRLQPSCREAFPNVEQDFYDRLR